MTRAVRLAQIERLRARGLSHRQIADSLGITISSVRNTLYDPDGSKQAARRSRYQGTCEACGSPTDGSNGRAAAPRFCQRHAWVDPARREAVTLWTRDRIISAIQWWAATYGEPPAGPDWDLGRPSYWNDVERYERAEHAIREGFVPWFTTVFERFGSWNAALEAAGFEPRPAHGGGGNQNRRQTARAKATT